MLIEFKDRTGSWVYNLPFDINQRDLSGQSILYMACCIGNLRMVDLLLEYKVKAVSTTLPPPEEETSSTNSSPKHKSLNLSMLISKFQSKEEVLKSNEAWVKPVDLDLYCNHETETALHVAVRGRHHAIASHLLAAGALPNLHTRTNTDKDSWGKGHTCLVEAAKNRDMGMIDLLLKYGARDDQNQALAMAIAADDHLVMSKLLALKAHQDQESQINRIKIAELHLGKSVRGRTSASSMTYNSMCPSTPVMINWHQAGSLTYIKEQWMVDSAVRLNPKLRLSPKYQPMAIHAITKLDLSNNEIVTLPGSIWTMQSLKFISLSGNKMEMLSDCQYNCPSLEEIQLQDNRLDCLPPGLFKLPSLSILDVSNNKLQQVPFLMWSCPSLTEINLSLNMLSDLPSGCHMSRHESVSSLSDGVYLDTMSINSDMSSDNQSVMSEMEADIDEDAKMMEERVSQLQQTPVTHCNKWKTSVNIVEKEMLNPTINQEDCKLQLLNLSHNSFKEIPPSLPCLAPHLGRLTLSYNNLTTIGPLSRYPTSLKQLDLSHNQITTWPNEKDCDFFCYSRNKDETSNTNPSQCSTPEPRKIGRSVATRQNSRLFCSHRRHIKLEQIRSLILSNNLLRDICIHVNYSDSSSSISEDAPDQETAANNAKSRLMFPNISKLDLGKNSIRVVPPFISELSNLSTFHIANNEHITELPPEMGLLSRLWNLTTKGCSLQEPLASMASSKMYKTMDIVGYLKSILEDAKPYARMKLMVVGVQGIGKTTLLENLRSEGGSYKRTKQSEHWARRMGNRNMAMKSGRGVSMSTVGVDIGDWTYEKKNRNQQSFGPVTFRTWDFGGQQEYYTTHQYFLSKRSLYLVLWKIVDGEKGINEIQQWLINIQARAPNSPVIIIGTHHDAINSQFPPSFSDYLQSKIKERFINLVDPEKSGLPRVIESLEVSCKTKHNIRHLANMIYDVAFSLKSHGSKQKLLDQKIPATYLHLEDIIGDLCVELRQVGRDPVLGQEEYESFVTEHMKNKFNSSFRDGAELHQATSFLHENGVMLHYDDATLKDLYFLDPQWLCDMLSHVVTIREINPFAKNGIMLLDDLKHVFKTSAAVSLSAKSYIVNLLNKFEVGLTWDSRTLLIPSLLPTEAMLNSRIPGIESRVTIPLRTRGWGHRGRRPNNTSAGTVGNNPAFLAQGQLGGSKHEQRSRSVPARRLLGSRDISAPMGAHRRDEKRMPRDYELSQRTEPDHVIRRLVLLAYLPSGFWSRLLSRILGDDTVVEIIRSYFQIPPEAEQDPQIGKIISENKPEWVCWQTGLELQYLDTAIFSVKEILPRSATSMSYHSMDMMAKLEGRWTEVEQTGSAILEICLPQDTVVIKRPIKDENRKEPIGYQALVLEPDPKVVCQFLSMAVEHIDQLLEDWYPSLGTRFVHTSEGKMLVTRLVPCPRCLETQRDKVENHPSKDWNFICSKQFEDLVKEGKPVAEACKLSQESNKRDSGMGQDAKGGTDDSMDRKLEIYKHGLPPQEDKVYTFLVEECILYAFDGKNAECPLHVELSLAQIAPDTVFLDLGDRLVMSQEAIKRGSLIGRGAFGFVFGATCRGRGGVGFREVAIKMLQPVDPGLRARSSSQAAFKAAMTKWERDPMQYACKAYCTARQELNILLHIKHPHVVPLVGICIKPLAIVLDLAPMGALDSMLKHYRRSGAKLGVSTIQQVLVQIARALEYLHQQHIIYRDLKSENVLVWNIPQPFEVSHASNVQVKLADYGISRACLPTGAKGFGGTEGFMAPEIMKYNGEEEYTEKVDCFSFGMFLYELLTLHQPFEGQETVKEVILEGGRPPLTPRELTYPTYFLDLMVACWSHHSRERPTASQIVSITSAPEFTHLLDVIQLDDLSIFSSSITTSQKLGSSESYQELWLASSDLKRSITENHLNIIDGSQAGWKDHFVHKEFLEEEVTAMTTVQDCVWVGTSRGEIHAFSTSTYKKLFCYAMDPDSESPAPVQSFNFIKSSGRVVVALKNGRIFLCQSNFIPVSRIGGEGTFILTGRIIFSFRRSLHISLQSWAPLWTVCTV